MKHLIQNSPQTHPLVGYNYEVEIDLGVVFQSEEHLYNNSVEINERQMDALMNLFKNSGEDCLKLEFTCGQTSMFVENGWL